MSTFIKCTFGFIDFIGFMAVMVKKIHINYLSEIFNQI